MTHVPEPFEKSIVHILDVMATVGDVGVGPLAFSHTVDVLFRLICLTELRDNHENIETAITGATFARMKQYIPATAAVLLHVSNEQERHK